MGLTSWASRWCVAGADSLQQINIMCKMRREVGDHPSLRKTLWSLCGNALWKIISSQLRNSAVISRRFRAPCCRKLSRSTCSENCTPAGFQSNWHQDTKESAWSQYWHSCGGTMTTVTDFWTGSSQMMKRRLHTLPQKPSCSQFISVTVHSSARRISADFVGAERDVHDVVGLAGHSPRGSSDPRWEGECWASLWNTA